MSGGRHLVEPKPAASDVGSLRTLADLVDAPALQSMMDDFYELTSIPMSLIDMQGAIIVGSGWQEVCTKFHRENEESCAHCIESDTELTAGLKEGQAKLYRCKNGMWDAAMPVIVDGQQIANVFTGQFFLDSEDIDLDFFRRQARHYGFPEREYVRAVESVPRLSQSTVDAGLRFLTKLADMLSRLALINSELASLARERQELLERERQQASKLRALAEVEFALASSLDLAEVIDLALRAAEEHIEVSASSVWQITDDAESLTLVGARGFPPGFAAEFSSGISLAEPFPVAQASRNGERVLFSDIRQSQLHEPVRSAYARYGIDLRSLVAVPLVAREKLLGGMTLAWERVRTFDENELALIDVLASRFAVAMENARLFETEHAVAETLQDTLVVLPTRVPGVIFSRAYESATYERGRVGGDFVDVFAIADDEVGIVLGDVSGKGLDAAVITSLTRTTLRVHALDGLPPAEIGARTNRVMRNFTEVDAFVTLWFGVLNTSTGLLRYISAGHPPALLIDGSGAVRELESLDPIMGAFDEARFMESRTVLMPGERLVLYSDGATEARSKDGVFLGDSAFASLVGQRSAAPTVSLSAEVMSDLIEYCDGLLRDDIAILVIERS